MKKFLLIVMFFFGLILNNITHGELIEQNNGAVTEQDITQDISNENGNLTLVATVNIYDALLKSQDNNNLKISFDFSNRELVQPDIRYAVQLIQEGINGEQKVIDEKLYDEVISLNENQTIKKEITYIAPTYLNGEFQVWLIAKNKNGLTLALANPGKVTLSGDNQFIEILSDTCYLKIEGNETNKYTLSQGVDIKNSESLIATCDITNHLNSNVELLPEIKTFWRTSFGDEVKTNNESQNNFTIKSKETNKFSFIIPKAEDPQAYDAKLKLKDAKGKIISNEVTFHYVLSGLSATIQNLRLDKSYYEKGEIANASFYWSGPADNFMGSRLGATDSGKLFFEIDVKDNVDKNCIEKVKKELDRNITTPEFDLPIIQNCINPNILVNIQDEKGEILDSKVFNIQSSNIPKVITEKNNGVLYIISIIIGLITIALVIFLFKKKSNLISIIFLLFITGMFFTDNEKANADTYKYEYYVGPQHYPFPNSYHRVVINVSNFKTSYNAGDPMTASMVINDIHCQNSLFDYTLSSTLKPGLTQSKIAGYGTANSISYLFNSSTTAPTTSGRAYFTFADNRCFSSRAGCQQAIDSCNTSSKYCNYFFESVKSIYVINKTSKLNRDLAGGRSNRTEEEVHPLIITAYGSVYKHYVTNHISEGISACKAICDSAGIAKGTLSIPYTIIPKPPTITDDYGSYDNARTNGSSKTITLYPVDNVSGIKTTKRCKGSSCDLSSGNVGTSIGINANYNGTIKYQTWNNYGLSSDIGSVIVKLDNSDPSVSADPPSTSWENSDIPIKLSASDTGGSGISQVRYSWLNNLNSGCTGGTIFSNGTSITATNEGTNTLYLCVVDNAGNVETWNGTYKLDNTSPIVSANNSSNSWKNTDIIITLSVSDGGGSGLSQARYSWSNNFNSTCTSGGTTFSNLGQILLTSEGNSTLYLCATDGAGNVGKWSGSYKIDRIPPKSSDIKGIGKDLDGIYFVADDSKDFSINIDPNGGSDINVIKGYFEKYNVKATNGDIISNGESVNSTTSSLNLSSRNVSYVDYGVNDLENNNYRIYTFKITEIRDEAGNYMSLSDLPTYNYYVYAENVNNSKSAISGEANFVNQIADGTEKTLNLTLRDKFLNKVVPVKESDGITEIRAIKLTANFTNTLFKDQYLLSGESGVKVSDFDNNNFGSAIGTQETTIGDVLNNDGNYELKFMVYSPTFKSSVIDGRQFARGSFSLNSINGDVSDITGGVNVYPVSTINFDFKPIYYTDITGDLSNTGSGFIEGTTQTGSLNIKINGSIKADSINGLYLVQTGSTSSYFAGSGIIDNSNITIPNIKIEKFLIGSSFVNSFIDGANYIIKTLFILTNSSGFISDIENLQLNQYIEYTIGGVDVKYLSYIFNSDNNQNFNTLKVQGITNIDSEKQKDLTISQDGNDIHNLAGEIIKSGLKNDIRKAAINTTKVIKVPTIGDRIDNLSGSNWDLNTDGKKLGNILYFGNLGGKTIILDNGNYNNLSSNKVEGKKTIIVKGGDLYIKSNIINNSQDDILGIIVLKDELGKGGKIYIDTQVQEIDAIIYNDKSIIGYNEDYNNGESDDVTKHEIDGNINNSVIQNQLYIFGTVFSENTIGGSRLNPPVCPFYTQNIPLFTCDTIEAQKYDFNYLRAGFKNKYKSSYDNYPIIIKYNSSIQATPPPLFENK